MNKRRVTTLVAGGLLALSSALAMMSGVALASVSPNAPANVAPSDPVVVCGGTVSFTDVPQGWYLVVEPGDNLVTSGFDSIKLDPGTYTYQWRDANANDMNGGTFVVGTCQTPAPPSAPVVQCGGTVSFSGVPQGWYLVVEPGDILVTSGFDSVALDPGVYTYEWRDANANDMVGGTFTIGVCPTAPPSCGLSQDTSVIQDVSVQSLTPCITAKPSATLPSTTTDATSAPGGTSTPVFALLICLALGAFGLAAVQMQRSSIRR
jgi:hypothetical protein